MSEPVVKTWNEELDGPHSGHIIQVRLNRIGQANAFNTEMMQGLTDAFTQASHSEGARALVLAGEGKHFSAGADLAWMKASAGLSYEDNISDAKRLTGMFESLWNLPIPTICVTNGAVYGGAVGLVACCDIVIATDTSRFCLSEARLGLLPAVILPYLARRMHQGFLRRAMLLATPFDAEEAKLGGLVNRATVSGDVDAAVAEEISALLQNGPAALRSLKMLYRDLFHSGFAQSDRTAAAIAAARTSAEGQHGLGAFFAQAKPDWTTPYGGNKEG